MLVSFLPLWIKFILQPVTSQFSGSVFSAATATSLLLPKFQPIVEFVDTGSHLWPRSVELWIPGPHYCNEDLSIVYTVRIEERRHLNSWDWIGVFRFLYNLSYMSCLRAQYRCSLGWVKATLRTTLLTPGPPLVLLGTLSMRSSEHQIMEKLALRNYCKQQEFTCAKNNHMNIAQTARWTPHAFLFVCLNFILGVDGYDHFPCPWPFSTGNDQTSPTFLKNVKW